MKPNISLRKILLEFKRKMLIGKASCFPSLLYAPLHGSWWGSLVWASLVDRQLLPQCHPLSMSILKDLIGAACQTRS